MIARALLYEHSKANFPTFHDFQEDTQTLDLGKDPVGVVLDHILADLKVEGTPLVVINIDELNQWNGDKHQLKMLIAQLTHIWTSSRNCFLFFILSGTNRTEMTDNILPSTVASRVAIQLPGLTIRNFEDIYSALLLRILKRRFPNVEGNKP